MRGRGSGKPRRGADSGKHAFSVRGGGLSTLGAIYTTERSIPGPGKPNRGADLTAQGEVFFMCFCVFLLWGPSGAPLVSLVSLWVALGTILGSILGSFWGPVGHKMKLKPCVFVYFC